jgi:hypothetical protein
MIPVINERDLEPAGGEWVEGSKIDGYPSVPKNIPPPPTPVLYKGELVEIRGGWEFV